MELAGGPLVGNGVTLRSLTSSDDMTHYVRWMNDPEVMQFTESRFARHTLEELVEYVRGHNASPGTLLLGIFEGRSDLHIGNIKVGDMNPVHRYADVGIVIGDKSCWGRGYASESLRLVCDYAFRSLALHKLFAGCYAQNEGAIRAFLNAGFVEEGRRLNQYLYRGQYTDAVQLGFVNPFEED
jgi:RimJ/RimL family protein N-acetyltransferase